MNISSPKALTEIPLIYNRAFDSYPDIIDCLDFFGQQSMAKSFIGQLLKNATAEETIQIPSRLIPTVQSLFFEARNQQRLCGNTILGIGYPMLSFVHNRQLIFAPLLIWPIQLEPHLKEAGKWQIQYFPTHNIQINPYLLNHWQTYLGWNHRDILQTYKTYPSLLQKTINELMLKISEEANSKKEDHQLIHDQTPFSLGSLPSLSTVGESEADISVYWSAVMGAFTPIYHYLPIHIAALKKEELLWKDSPLGINVVNPDQASAWSLIQQNKSTLIKSDFDRALPLLLHLISNLLSNGHTGLIVANRQNYLHKLLEKISADKLDTLSFLFRNTREDWPLLRKLVIKGLQHDDKSSFDNPDFESLQSSLIRLQTRLAAAYEAVKQPVFKGMNFRETVGYYLHNQKQQGKELLNSQLEETDFSFSNAEYEEINQAIKTSFPLYQQINTLNHPLETLHPSIFSQTDGEEAYAKLELKLVNYKNQLTKVQHLYIAGTNRYAEALYKYYDSVVLQLSAMHQQLTENLKKHHKKYGVDFQLTSLASLQLISRFSNKYKIILKAKREAIDLFQQLVKYFDQHAYFDFQFKTVHERRNLAKWEPELDVFQTALSEWKKILPAHIKKELLRLSPAHTKENLAMGADMLSLEQALETEIVKLNAANIFQEEFKNVMLTLQKQQQYLESIVEKIEQTQIFLKDFPAFFQWKKCWTGLSPTTRNVIKALTKVKPTDWLTAFNSWFLHHRLSAAFSDQLPDQSLDIDTFAEQHLNYTQQLPNQIQALWANRIERSRKEWKSTDKMSYQSFFSDPKQEEDLYFSWVDQILSQLKYITQHRPLFLTSPSGALQLSRKGDFQFDYVLLLDGNLQSLQEAQPAFQLGKKTIILQDFVQKNLSQHQQALSEYTTELPSYDLSKENRKITLENHWKNLKEHTPQILQIIEADGRFNEQEGANIVEAQETFRLLNNIEQTPHRTYPVVHIVTMTRAQRNLIYGYLLDIKKRNLPGKEKIQQLERNGLTVYSIDEVPLPAADYIIINNTYGLIDSRGGITEQLDRWKKATFELQMRNLLSKSLQKVFVLNSIPISQLEDLKRGNVSYVSLLLSYMATEKEEQEAIIPEQEAEKEEILSAKLYFTKEVYEQLKPYLDSHRLELNIEIVSSPGIIIIHTAEDPSKKVGILPDGFWGDSPTTHFTWEYQQLERYRDQGIHIVPTWSVWWWKDPNQEIRRLMDSVDKILD